MIKIDDDVVWDVSGQPKEEALVVREKSKEIDVTYVRIVLI